MNTFLYIIIFIIGTFFGSFYTLAVYRIPKREDITHTHSYCPNCNHKLGFLDLFPIFSYIFLGAKCRYCKQKIRPRYFILEILSGVLFLTVALFLKINIYTLNVLKIVEFGFISLYITYIVLICGIDKENRNMNKGCNIYGIVIAILYMVYLYIVDKSNIYRYGIYLILYIIILTFDTITLKKYAKNSYVTGILLMLVTMTVFTSPLIVGTSVIITLFAISFTILLYKIKVKVRNKKTDKQIANEISIGFYLGVTNIITLLYTLLIGNYII